MTALNQTTPRTGSESSNAMGVGETAVEPRNFTNYYKCPCGHQWQDTWSCACNDRCPACNKEIEPFDSHDGSTSVAKAAHGDIDPTNPRIYMQVMIDAAMQLKYQDTLDAFFDIRMRDVRNCLRCMGWVGSSAVLSKGDVRVTHRCTHVGAGRNVVGVEYDIEGGPFGLINVTDNLYQSALELAEFLDLHAPKQVADETPWVVVGNPGCDDQFEIGSYPTMVKGYRNVNLNPGSDLMKRLADGSLTSEF